MTPPRCTPVTRRGTLAGAAALLAAAAPAGRVVALDYGLAETLLALGRTPVGLPDPADYRAWVVQPTLPGGVEDVGQRTQPNLEVLSALAPDLVLAIGDHDPILPLLRRIAPVLRLPIYTRDRQPWQRSVAAAQAIAAALGTPDTAARLVDGVDARFAAARAALEPRRIRPLLLASFVDPRHLRVYGAASILGAALDRLGLRNAWQGPTGIWGSATLGLEALAAVPDAALFVIDPVPPDLDPALAASPLWQALPMVRAGRVARLPPVLMFGTLPAADRFLELLLPRLHGSVLLD